MLAAIVDTLRETWAGYLEGLRWLLPRLLAATSVLVAGWLVAAAASWAVRRSLLAARIGRLAERTGTAEVLRKAELPPIERLVASSVFWLLFVGFLLAGLDALGLETIATLGDELRELVPRLVTAGLILALGLLAANVAWRASVLAAVNSGWRSARVLGAVTRGLVIALTVAMALDHLRIARAIVLTGFGALMLALAIALGIGLGPIVRRALGDGLRPPGQPRRDDDASSHL